MERNDDPVLDTVIDVVCRYGIKRTTMDELARHSGVSRKTLYDRYGGKDGIIASAITMAKGRLVEALGSEFAKRTALNDKIDTYYSVAIQPVFEAMRTMPDAADLERGLGVESKAASDAALQRRHEFLTDMFEVHVLGSKEVARQIAVFFERSCNQAMMSFETAEDLRSYLAVLKASTLALVEGQHSKADNNA